MNAGGFPWRVLLLVSLALNLLLVGAVVGAFASGARLERTGAGQGLERLAAPRAFMQALPPQTRREVRRELLRSAAEMRAERQQARAARAALYDVAAAEPYDAARVRDAFAAVRAADGEVAAHFHAAVADAMARLTPEERRAALEAVRRDAQGRFQDRRDQTGDAPPAP